VEEIILALEARLNYERYLCEKSLAQFTRSAWHIIEPGAELQWNWHIDTVCGYLEAFHSGVIKPRRLIINIPPGTLKSVLVSVMYPAWVWTRQPEERFMNVTNEQGLATRDSLRMKQIVTSEWYQRNWPMALQSDQNEKTLFANERRGFRQSIGVTAGVTGKRAGTILLDDLLDAKAAFSDVQRVTVNDAWDQALSSRLNDPQESGVILIMQRLHEQDLTGHLLKKSKTPWMHLAIPMMYEGHPSFDAGRDIGKPELNDPRKKKGQLLFSSRFTKAVVESAMEDLGEYGIAGQYQQRPVPAGGGIIKKHWWRRWPNDIPVPFCEHTFHSWDTAFSTDDHKKSAHSARTRWGIFWNEQRQRWCLICLGVWNGQVGYDELREKAIQDDRDYEPDAQVIEAKATGISLLRDLRRALPSKIRSYSPGTGGMLGSRGEDKISRAHAASAAFESGLVYIPDKSWTDTLINYVAAFPNGAPPSADITDTVTMAVIYLQNNHWISHPDDDEPEEPKRIFISDEERDDYESDSKISYKGVYDV
jgi:phage terminase large subunit-like protein